ncbi:unnamed protein product [Ilex paraguariensis]|uniref:Uncharacterized protein n=1 Tax=Ilex paraguariensis TaxID=185542 RepID=A0ABC8RKG5_9AQUA
MESISNLLPISNLLYLIPKISHMNDNGESLVDRPKQYQKSGRVSQLEPSKLKKEGQYRIPHQQFRRRKAQIRTYSVEADTNSGHWLQFCFSLFWSMLIGTVTLHWSASNLNCIFVVNLQSRLHWDHPVMHTR